MLNLWKLEAGIYVAWTRLPSSDRAVQMQNMVFYRVKQLMTWKGTKQEDKSKLGPEKENHPCTVKTQQSRWEN